MIVCDDLKSGCRRCVYRKVRKYPAPSFFRGFRAVAQLEIGGMRSCFPFFFQLTRTSDLVYVRVSRIIDGRSALLIQPQNSLHAQTMILLFFTAEH